MKIEKLNENKIRITFNHSDLEKNNVDVHSFMSNSIESQSLFLHLLDEAEREIGFITDNYKLSIEALALSNGNFILTVTRIEKEILKSTRVQARRKTLTETNQVLVYQFANFDDFCNFTNFLSVSLPKFVEYLSECNSLYQYQDCFFLVLENFDKNYVSAISSVISEFGMYVQNSDLVFHKVKECGTLVTENVLHTK